jgi:alpha/beta superfamily hydrolase
MTDSTPPFLVDQHARRHPRPTGTRPEPGEHPAWSAPTWLSRSSASTGGSADHRPLFAWLHMPAGVPTRGVVVCPAFGYEACCSYRSLRKLAIDLAARGAAVIRFDYEGTGDSAGHYTDADWLPACRASVGAAVRELKSLGVSDITLLGLRFGAALALLEAKSVGADEVILWDAVVSGRKFVRELKIFGASAAPDKEPDADGAVEVAGTVYTAQTIASVSKVDLLKEPFSGVRRALVVDREDRPGSTALAALLRDQAVDVTLVAAPGTPGMLDVPNEDATIPQGIVDSIVGWVEPRRRSDAGGSVPASRKPSTVAEMAWDEHPIQEEMCSIGKHHLFGILGAPKGAQPSTVVVLLNSGTESRIGPGRVWVEFARSMNRHGYATIRADFDGVGDSDLRGRDRVARPYDPEFLQDVRDFVDFARGRGFRKVVVAGLCSGAWMAVQAGLCTQTDAVVAINPQLYWSPGDPVEARLTETRARLTPIRQRDERGRRYHLWSALDLVGVRPDAARWLDGLDRKGVRTLLAFAAGDDGLEYLQTRVHRRLGRLLQRGIISKAEVAGVDHPMHRYRKRPEMLSAILGFLETI